MRSGAEKHVRELVEKVGAGSITRREFLTKAALLGLSSTAMGSILAACQSDDEVAQPGTTRPGTTGAGAADGEPVSGGRLRVGLVGGGPAETLDPHQGVAYIDEARAVNVFEKLVDVRADLSKELKLAESVEPNADGSRWQIKLRQGITWHDGRPLTVDDVLYTWRRITDPDRPLASASALAPVDLERTRRVDDHTMTVELETPIADLLTLLSGQRQNIVPQGATEFSEPVGTGPFKVGSFTPGARSLFVRNEDYWMTERPFLDELEIISIPDTSARVNALIANEVDAIEALDFPQARAHADSETINLLSTAGPLNVPIYMRMDQEPFTDNRVRQAFRLAINREATVETALLGFGEIGNDLFVKGAPSYNDQLPQRERDPEQARFLLQEAGYEDIEVTLHTGRAGPGMIESATLLAEQANEAGISINLRTLPADSYYSEDFYLKIPFGQTQWNHWSIESQFVDSLVSDAPFNETAWKRPEWDAKLTEARATLDEDLRHKLFFELQEELWEEGGYIIWGFQETVDAVRPNVRGIVPTQAGFSLGWYDFANAWMA